MNFTNTKNGDALVVHVTGRMDAITAPEFDDQCQKWIDDGNTTVVIDLGDLEYISSAGLRSILAAAKRLKGTQGELRFSRLSGMVEEVFNVSGFAAMFKIYKTTEDALAG
jgi:anti-sigma B factor antagonist